MAIVFDVIKILEGKILMGFRKYTFNFFFSFLCRLSGYVSNKGFFQYIWRVTGYKEM